MLWTSSGSQCINHLTWKSTVNNLFAFQGTLALMNSALDPLLDAIQLELENYIFKMHSEDFTR